MTKQEYKEKRAALIARAHAEPENAEAINAAAEEIEALDAEFSAAAIEAANAAAAIAEPAAIDLKNMSRPVAGGKVMEKMENVKRVEGGASALEYRNAFLKHLAGRDAEMTELENAAFVHTTTTTSQPLPTTMLDQIWDLVSGEHSIMGDVNVYRTGTIMEVVKHTAIAQGAAAKKAEGTANDDEQNTFVKVTLSGNDFVKHVDISYAMEKMSIDALENYLITEIARGIGGAMADDAISTIKSGTATANKINAATAGTVAFADLAKTFGLLKRVGDVCMYVDRSTFYNHIVGLVDTAGRPIFQPDVSGSVSGYVLGAAVKMEDSVGDGIILVGDAKKVIYNMIQDIMIETDRDIKKHVVTHSGYARGEGALIDDKAFAMLTVGTAAKGG